VSVLLLAALVLRAAVPAGYMPASPGSGLLFELCPEGMPALYAAVQAANHHHQHDHHGPKDAASGGGVDHCPIGHMLSSAAAADSSWQADHGAALPADGVVPYVVELHGRITVAQRSRGPPA